MHNDYSDRRCSPAMSPLGAALTVALAIVLSFLFIESTLQIRTDDSYIFLVYARNLAQGNGFVFNPGEYVNGCTSVLFPILIALLGWPLQWFHPEPFFLASRAVQTLSLAIICVMAAKLCRRMGAPWAIAIFPLLFFTNRLVVSGVGMESFLVLALILWTIELYMAQKLRSAAIAAGFLTLARPDSLLLFAPLAIHYLWARRRLPPRAAVLCYCMIVLPWIFFAWWYFGSPLPGTLAAKSAQTESGRWGQGMLFLKGFVSVRDSYGAATGMLALLSAVTIATMSIRSRAIAPTALFILFGWISLYFIAYALVINPPAYSWYYTPFSLPLALMVALALSLLLSSLPHRVQRLFGAGAIVCCSALYVHTIQALHERPQTAKHEIYRLAAGWLNENAPAGSSVSCNEVGVLGYYYTKGKIIDPLGLITGGAAEHVRNKQYAWYIRDLSPDFLVFNHPPRSQLEDFHRRDWFKGKYEVATVVKSGRSAVRIYRRKLDAERA